MRRGDFTRRVEVDRQDEFGMLAEGFNRMTGGLSRRPAVTRKNLACEPPS